MSTLSRLGRGAALAVVLSALSACQALIDPNGAQETAEGVVNARASDSAVSALTRGDYSAAERYALTALRYNPRDPLGLLVAGLAYQGLGRYDLARQYYEVILTSNISGTIMTAGDGGVAMPRSVMDVASANMAMIDQITGRNAATSAAQSGRAPGASAVGGPTLPFATGEAGGAMRPDVSTANMRPVGEGRAAMASVAEHNVASRFRILKALLDGGLITPEEYRVRRSANTGALLPYTGRAPGVGLDRPVPADQAVIRRLQALGRSLEHREITPEEHAAERETILNALLPAQAVRSEIAPRPPADMLEAGQAVGRVERMRTADLISADEAAKEKAAIEQRYRSQISSQPVEGTVSGLRPVETSSVPAPAKPAAAKGAGQWGVSLASAASENEAKTAWASIKRKFPEELGKYEASYRSNGDGSKWRVLVGPLASKTAATKLCKTLKLHRQACDAASM